MLGVGVIGCGAISKLHVDSYLEMDNVVLKAVSDVNSERAKKVGYAHNIDCYESFEELLTRDDIDLVSICTPSGLHKDIVIAAAEAKKHIIVEKPIDVTLEKIDAMIAACRHNDVKLACIFNNRYREGNIFIKKAIEADRFGKIINANALIRWYREPDYYLGSNWRGTWALDGGGALMNQSIHYIDLLIWLAGGVQSVFAYTGTLLHKTIETEDTAVASLRFKNGALGSIIAATSIYPGFAADIQITGERGSVSISDGVINYWLFNDKDSMDEEANEYMSNEVDNDRASVPMAFSHFYHKKQIISAIDSILKDQEPDINGEEARKSVELILHIYKSAKEKREIILA